jgi:hypothetical protein
MHDDREVGRTGERDRPVRGIARELADVAHLVAVAVGTRQAGEARPEVDHQAVEARVAPHPQVREFADV